MRQTTVSSAILPRTAAVFRLTSRIISLSNSTSRSLYQATVADSIVKENGTEQQADHAGAIIGFATKKGETVHARVASSFISLNRLC